MAAADVTLEKEVAELEKVFDAVCQANDLAKLRALCEGKSRHLTTHCKNRQFSLLEKACMWYSNDVIKCLIDDCGANINDVGQKPGGSLLRYILYTKEREKGLVDKIRYLVEVKKINPNKTDANDDVPFILAFTNGNDYVDIVQMFIGEYGIDINHRNKEKKSLLQLAIDNKACQVASLFLDNEVCETDCVVNCEEVKLATMLEFVIRNRNIRAFNKLMSTIEKDSAKAKRIANVSVSGNNLNGTCLHAAAGCMCPTGEAQQPVLQNEREEKLSVEVARKLLACGANKFVINSNNEIALHIAARSQDAHVGKLLLESEAPKQMVARDLYGKTPLLTAVANSAIGVQRLFLGHCDQKVIKAGDYMKRNIYHLAAASEGTKNRMNVITPNGQTSKLLPTDVQVELLNQTDRDSNTPIDIAAARGDVDVIKLILSITQTSAEKQGHPEMLQAASAGKLQTCVMLITATDAQCLKAKDEFNNSAVHLAASNGRFEVVNMLTSYAPPEKNRYGQTPLHLASAAGHLDIVQHLIASSDSNMVTEMDRANLIPLHYAAMKNKVDVFDFLLEQGSSVSARDITGRNALDIAIDNKSFAVGQAIIKGKNWKQVMMNEITPDDNNTDTLDDDQNTLLNSAGDKNRLKLTTISGPRETPMRRMIRKLSEPELALAVFDRCLDENGRGDVEYIDDTFALSQFSDEQSDKLIDISLQSVKKVCEVLDVDQLKSNHPLSIMIDYRQEKLLDHCLIKALIIRKCKWPKIIYILSILMYLLLVILTTAFIHITDPRLNTRWPSNDSEVCDHFVISMTESKLLVIKYLQKSIWGLLIVCTVVEIIQLTAGLKRYFKDLTNYLDWFCYVTILLITLNCNTECSARTMWQWVLSAFSLLLSWINVAVQMRRLSGLGIYVFMLKTVALSFGNFLIVLSVFITAFASAFFVLIENQSPFSTVWHAILKTAVMFTGEQDYKDLFYGEQEVSANQDGYIIMLRFALYVIFLPVMCIIVLNLLIALAVGDLSELMRTAKFKQLNLSVDLALDVEYILSSACLSFSCASVKKLRYCLLHKLGLASKFVKISQNGVKHKTPKVPKSKQAQNAKINVTQTNDEQKPTSDETRAMLA